MEPLPKNFSDEEYNLGCLQCLQDIVHQGKQLGNNLSNFVLYLI